METARTEAAAGRLTYEDFLLFPDDGRRHELIGGEHFRDAIAEHCAPEVPAEYEDTGKPEASQKW